MQRLHPAACYAHRVTKRSRNMQRQQAIILEWSDYQIKDNSCTKPAAIEINWLSESALTAKALQSTPTVLIAKTGHELQLLKIYLFKQHSLNKKHCYKLSKKWHRPYDLYLYYLPWTSILILAQVNKCSECPNLTKISASMSSSANWYASGYKHRHAKYSYQLGSHSVSPSFCVVLKRALSARADKSWSTPAYQTLGGTRDVLSSWYHCWLHHIA